MAERGVIVTYESVREWCLKFGQSYAKRMRSRSQRPGDRCIWMKSFSRLRASGSIFGVPLIRMARYLIF